MAQETVAPILPKAGGRDNAEGHLDGRACRNRGFSSLGPEFGLES